jgi:alkanesulfonate monooxygenase SsuD/methylene tetrahydromethanopterin reductase-like flavin-dependent oxidoreductase (luciferase family)
MLDLTARYADLWNGWLVFGRSHPDAIPPLRDKLDAACLAAGRDPATLGRTVAILVSLDLPEAGPVGAGEEPLTGTPAEIAAALRAFARAGIGHVQIMLNPNTSAGLRALAPALALLEQPAPVG